MNDRKPRLSNTVRFQQTEVDTMQIKTRLISTLILSGLSIPMLQAQEDGQQQVNALVEDYCMECHNSEDWSGGLAFDLMNINSPHQDPAIWETAIKKLRGRLMPPPGSSQPEQARLDRVVSTLEDKLDSHASGRAGHVPAQRLSRTEYGLRVEQLLGLEIDPAAYLPADIETDGFDNIAEALTTSPSYVDQFVSSARKIAAMAVGDPTGKRQQLHFPVSDDLAQDGFQDGFPPGTRGGMKFTHTFTADGLYHFNVLDLDIGLYPRSVETRNTLVILVDGREVFRGDLGGPEDLALVNQEGPQGASKIMERFQGIPVEVDAGQRDVVVTFIERARAETDEPIGGFVAYGGFSFQGELRVPRILDGIEIEGPIEFHGLSSNESRDRIFICQPDSAAGETECARRITENLARKAFRRPVTVNDIERLMPFYDLGRNGPNGSFDAGIEKVVAAILASPDFLFRTISIDKDIGDAPMFALNDEELASRLAFFLWSRGPDETLLELAVAGELSQPEVLRDQVTRMLEDPKAEALVNNFALKWLNLDDLEAIDPQPGQFPSFDEQLREDFSTEVKMFISSILLENRSIIDLLNADHTFLNEQLARHYGINDVHGAQFRRVELDNPVRHGLLGKAAVLLRTSYGDRTSPVLRGAWVLDKIVGTPPAPPPPNVETDLSAPDGELPTTVRARLEEHRANPSCNQCHGVIDPIGLALENFNVDGRWRTRDEQADQPIDASTVLPTGVAIDGVVELRRELAGRPEQFALSMTEKMLMYAVSRELEYFDMPTVRAIVEQAAEEDYSFSAIVQGIVASDAFRNQALPHGESPLAGNANVNDSRLADSSQ